MSATTTDSPAPAPPVSPPTRSPSRISSLMGTWTARASLATDIGSISLSTHVVIHFACDPLAGLRCDLGGCDPMDNQICLVEQDAAGLWNDTRCGDMATDPVAGPDVAAYFHFGMAVDAGFPFNVHDRRDTGG
mmetsp:Transcript_39538/g.77245  ORF Transcript_39538/g.77245 Transcript_39538/m.77245 type:complete len:133 (+) Transcript_39538:77-475(+)